VLNDPELYDAYEGRAGDTLERIARKTLGSADQATAIFEANRDQMETPTQLRAGAVLRIPRSV